MTVSLADDESLEDEDGASLLTVGVGSTAVGQVISWDANTRVLKYVNTP